jgi:hypothetical protein
MIVTANRMRSIGWIALLGLCAALVLVLSFRVNALRSQVHREEQRIISLRQEKMYLETEFETRANQQQLKAWNDVEFGYVAPGAGQYLENERQLASLSKPSEPDAPAPIRVATVDDSVIAAAAFPQMVSPISGRSLAAEAKAIASDVVATDDAPARSRDHAAAAANLGERLGKVARASDDEDKPTPRKVADKKASAKAPVKTASKAGTSKEKAAAKAASGNSTRLARALK